MKILRFFISRELWIGVPGSMIATIIITYWNKIPFDGIKQLLTIDYIKAILLQPIPLYVILIAALVMSLMVFLVRIRHQPGFLKETTMKMGGFVLMYSLIRSSLTSACPRPLN